ncbi:HlyD family efflux transporter periplasmic adaptor subunit [Clostridium sp.]|uniref:efflux RND transporter periplasmic adaptor subunit n=1 Tax=Clostridium sp. TaxID=1506 RepID=UPI002FC8A818
MAKTKKKNKKGLIFGMVIVVAVTGLGAMTRFKNNRENQYSEVTPKIESIETYFTFSGNVESKNTQNVMAEKVMQLSEIKVSEGDYVEKDDLLFKTSQGESIKAKVAGTVSKIYVEEDASVMAGAKLCDIIDFDNLQVTIKVDEYDLSSLAIDKEVSVTIGAIDKKITGKLSDISDTAINQNGVAYFTATLDLEKDSAVKVGMTTEAKIINNSVKDVLTIPVKALQFNEEDETYVYIKGDRNVPTMQIVEVGINDGKTVEITEGLSDNQVVMYENVEASSDETSGLVPPMRERQGE